MSIMSNKYEGTEKISKNVIQNSLAFPPNGNITI